MLAVLLSCSTQTKHPLSCNENAGADKLLVFIGEKISIKGMNDEKDIMDAKFLATYKIREIVCGSYEKENIDFIVYDHYGMPEFEKYETVMLYVSQDTLGFYHQKYLFHPLYKTKDGRWASPVTGSSYEYSYDTTNPSLKPERIDFANEVSFPTAGLKKREVKYSYPEPFYKIVPGKAIAEYGNYVPELFMQSKTGVLTNRGIFGDEDDEVIIRDVIVQEIEEPIEMKLNAKERKALQETWNDFITAISVNDVEKIKQMSIDSVTCSVCEGFTSPDFYNDKEPIDTFISSSQVYFPGSNIWEAMKAGKYELEMIKYPGWDPEEYGLALNQPVILHEFIFNTTSKTDRYRRRIDHKFTFVKREGKYLFSGMRSN